MKSKADRSAAVFINELSGIRDLSIRRHKIVEALLRLRPEEAASILEAIISGNIKGNPKCRAVYLALVKNRDVSDRIGYERVSQIYAIAMQRGFEGVMELLRTDREDKGREPEISHLSHKLMHLTLGEKKTLARRQSYKNLEFLLYDSDPTVIANVLKNPKITEQDVIKVASGRFATPGVLEEIFKSDKWISRYRVKKALVFNENTPLDIGLNLLSFLLKQDLRRIAKDGKLKGRMVERAKSLLKGKEG